MWQRHWNLTHDPFEPRLSPFVATETHAEAVARLVYAVETSGRSARLVAEAGSGKSTVLTRALELVRRPDRRLVRINGPIDGASLFAACANSLGVRVAPGASRATAWRALVDACRLCRWQRLAVVLAVDDCEGLVDPLDRLDLARLDHLDPDPTARLTVLRVGRESLDPDSTLDNALAVRLLSLTRAEVAGYVAAKLEAAGRREPTFTPHALTRLHALSAGLPRGVDRLARFALIGSAMRGLEMVSPEAVEGSARECVEGGVAGWRGVG